MHQYGLKLNGTHRRSAWLLSRDQNAGEVADKEW